MRVFHSQNLILLHLKVYIMFHYLKNVDDVTTYLQCGFMYTVHARAEGGGPPPYLRKNLLIGSMVFSYAYGMPSTTIHQGTNLPTLCRVFFFFFLLKKIKKITKFKSLEVEEARRDGGGRQGNYFFFFSPKCTI